MLRKYIITPVLVATLAFSFSGPSMAGVISTQQALSADVRAAKETHVRGAMARDDVRQAMLRMGVNPAEVDGRIASLSDAELLQLEGRVEQLPAGGVWEAIGVIVLVVLILELLGVTNMFDRF